jgi:hypothetical protein
MDFPRKTLELADRVAYEINRNSKDDMDKAKQIFRHLNNRFSYGFGEGFEQGLFLRWPHELNQEWECIEAALYTYALAEALHLKPRMMSVENWEKMDTGHDTVDVSVNGKRILIDPLNDMFGPVSYKKDKINVENNDLTKICELECTNRRFVSKDEIIARTHYYRSDEGLFNLLCEGQRICLDKINDIFIHFDRKQQILKFEHRVVNPFIDPNYYSFYLYIRGKDVKKVELEQGIYKHDQWQTMEGKESFWRTTKDIEKGTSTSRKFPLKQFGMTNLLSTLVYHKLLEQKYPGCDTSDKYYFEYRERPLDRLAEKIEQMERAGITAETKKQHHYLRKSYLRIIGYDYGPNQQMQKIFDYASLRLFVKEQAEQHDLTPMHIYNRILNNLGVDPKEIEEHRKWDPFGQPFYEVFPVRPALSLIYRFNDIGLIR